ncbi:hypothetical protein K435DRAFT_676282 [Dendrothele bispora CBS 962.96]|uniref:alpha-galactosidase n=1 Tax=Dendrothele bispora (strain CBS 962.96) TaxID=1314807 RepID=A0A4S8LLY7_DENBC|nr:hypothetical protein K435DRAFT_676282 [Dendrothele bispora CBS 962.96]
MSVVLSPFTSSLGSLNVVVLCEIKETLIRETADNVVKLGLADVGYNYVNVDDCYSEKRLGISSPVSILIQF